MSKSVSILFCLLPIFCSGQVKIDDSAIALFWEVADTLIADQQPSAPLWEKLAKHPAYAQIERSGNRVRYLKRVLPIVFQPSKQEKLQEILNGPESFNQYLARHLLEIKTRRNELAAFLKGGNFNSYKNAYQASLSYLPDDITAETIDLSIYLALFEENGFGGTSIVIDLLALLKNPEEENRDFIAHEFHHALRDASMVKKVFQPIDTTMLPLTTALDKLPLEGVASMIDKNKYFSEAYQKKLSTLPLAQQESVAEFQVLMETINANLGKIDAILSSQE
ncbi:MAG: DUF5700 domain-containing putative Zn-dependent protease [Bacteroidota bacterium]